MSKQNKLEITNQLTEEFLKKGGLSSRKEKFETLWCLADEKGKGLVREINLRAGLKMVIVNCQPDKNLAIDMEIKESPLEFNFFLSGMVQNTTNQARSKKNSFIINAGQTCIGYYPESFCTIEPVGKKPLHVLNILLTPQLCADLTKDLPDPLSEGIHSIVEGTSQRNHQRLGLMTASM